MADYDFKPVDTTNEAVNNDDYYRDPTHLPDIPSEIVNGQKDPISIQLATWIRGKMYGIDVREALARAVEYFAALYFKFKNESESLTARQDNVEDRISSLEAQLTLSIQSTTADAEVINARNSERFGAFPLVDNRMESIEAMLAKFIPVGFSVKIYHSLSRNPIITVKQYFNAIDTETSGFDTSGQFGGSSIMTIPTDIKFSDSLATVTMPAEYKQAGTFYTINTKEILLIEGNKILKFEIEDGATSGQF